MPRAAAAPEDVIRKAVLAVEGGMSQRKAADKWSVPLGTLKSRIRRAKATSTPDASTPRSDASTPVATHDAPKIAKSAPDASTLMAAAEDGLRLLDPREQIFVLVLLQTRSQRQAAEAAGIAESTASEWKRRPRISAVLSRVHSSLAAVVFPLMTEAFLAANEGLVESVDMMRAFMQDELPLKYNRAGDVIGLDSMAHMKAATEMRHTFATLAKALGYAGADQVDMKHSGGVTVEEQAREELAHLPPEEFRNRRPVLDHDDYSTEE